MKRLSLAILALIGFVGVLLAQPACFPISPVGGSPGTGGSIASGGAGLGGKTHVAGAPAQTGGASTGGVTATGGKPPCSAYVEPTAPKTRKVHSPAELKAFKSKVKISGWQRDPQRQMRTRWRPTYSIGAALCSVAHTPNAWKDGTRTPFNQEWGSCTTNATGGILSTAPWVGHLTQDEVDNQIYPLATRLDPFPGTFPPDDTGSNGQSAWKAATQLGFTNVPLTAISSIDELISAMQVVSCMVGVDWYDKMFEPTQTGELVIGGKIAGGHQLHAIQVNLELKRIWFRNSWGSTYGLSRGDEVGGYVYMSFGTLQKLVNAGGEIDCPASPPVVSQRLGFGEMDTPVLP